MVTITKAIRAPTLTVSATMPMMIPAIVAPMVRDEGEEAGEHG